MKFLERLFKVIFSPIVVIFVTIAVILVALFSFFYWLFTGNSGVKFFTEVFINIQNFISE